MITITPLHAGAAARIHVLKALTDLINFPIESVQRCLIQKQSDGRLAIMSYSHKENFYKVFELEQEAHDSFEELEAMP